MIKHTKTPYSLELVEAGIDPAHYRIVSDSDMSIIVDLHCQPHQTNRMKEDAEFMIKACNNYDRLVANLEFALKTIQFDLYGKFHSQGHGITKCVEMVNDDTFVKQLQQTIKDAKGA